MISGDTFRASADVVVDSPRSLRNLLKDASPLVTNRSLFIDLGFAEKTSWTVFEKLAPVIRNCQVILHNGDHGPPAALLHAFADMVGHVWSVNYFEDHPRIECIPIGLENRWLRTNGVVADFETESATHAPPRQTRILVSFNVCTNAEIRGAALGHLQLNTLADERRYRSPHAYHDSLRRYKFVASPPGNGADCHRTWEAIYLGTVPIVLSRYFSESFRRLPILPVDDFSDPRLRDEAFLDETYAEFQTRPRDLAYASHWLEQFAVDSPRTLRP
jgi:hypothetical protein